MVYIQHNIPSPNKSENFSLRNFTGGLNNKSGILEENECSDIRNMIFSDDGVMEKRKGSIYFDELQLDGPVTFIDEFRPYKSSNIMVRASESEMYIGDTKVMDLSGKMTGVNFGGKYFFVDGSGLYVYGTFAQESSTYVGLIGTVSADFVLMEVVTPVVGEYTPLGKDHDMGKTVYDYDARKVWYEPCEFEIEDTYKQGNVIPESPRFIIVSGGRLFVSGDDKDDDNVFISDVNNAYYFPASLPMQLPPNSDRVAGLAVYDDAVIIGRRRDMYAIHGTTNRTDMGVPVFRLEKLNAHAGFASHEAINNGHNYLFYLGSDGNAYILSNTKGGDNVVTTTIITKSLNLFHAPVNLHKEDIYTASSIFFGDNWYVSMEDRVMVYSYENRAWTMYDGLHARSFYMFYDILVWGNEFGRTVMPSENYLDFGMPYEAKWVSKYFDMGDANSFKYFKEFFVVAHAYRDYLSTINVIFKIDYADSSNDFEVKNQISIWGRSVFGDVFRTNNINASIPLIVGRRGRNMQFTMSNSFKVQGAVENYSDLEYYLEPEFNQLVVVSSTDEFYLFSEGQWVHVPLEDLNQPMRVYQINGEYEYRGKR